MKKIFIRIMIMARLIGLIILMGLCFQVTNVKAFDFLDLIKRFIGIDQNMIYVVLSDRHSKKNNDPELDQDIHFVYRVNREKISSYEEGYLECTYTISDDEPTEYKFRLTGSSLQLKVNQKDNDGDDDESVRDIVPVENNNVYDEYEHIKFTSPKRYINFIVLDGKSYAKQLFTRSLNTIPPKSFAKEVELDKEIIIEDGVLFNYSKKEREEDRTWMVENIQKIYKLKLKCRSHDG